MAIIFQERNRIFTLTTEHTLYQMKVDDFGFLLHLYYGKKAPGDFEYLLTYYDRGFSGNPYDAGEDRTYSLDVLPQEYPGIGTGDYRSSALIIRNHDGTQCCDLRYAGYEIKKGKYGLPGLPAVYASDEEADTLEILLKDSVSHVRVKLLYGVLWKEDIITRSAVIINGGEYPVTVEKAASACLDFLSGEYDMISFYGRHAMERSFQRTPIAHGSFGIGSRRGASSHQYNPGVVLAEKDATEDHGMCYGMLFVYSGNFMCEAEKDQYGQTRALMGLHSDLFSYPLEKEKEFVVPETILCCSDSGLGDLSVKYHRCIREHLCRGRYRNSPRPVLINSWEAAYFDFNGETVCGLAKEAAELGMDMVVMDDGWFGKRGDDNSGLGDWHVNEEKLGCTLSELIRKVNDTGVKFGIWIEPEMVSEDSNLYREHPDWAIQIPGRAPVRGRNQLVLDFSREEVRDYIYELICDILDQGNVEYIKWDMNRSLSDIYSSKTSQGKVIYDYVLGVYDFLEKLTNRYPDILLEGCCGGGGRFDAGMMYYTPQIWCSDNTDAVDRVRIQYGTSFFYPMSAVGAHVSAVPNHQTGRSASLNTRGVVAMTGAFGYELSPEKLTKEEKEEIKKQIRQYKYYEGLIHTGDYYRLSNPFQDNLAAWMSVSEDADRALLSVVMLEIHGNMTVNYVKMKGLEADAIYEEMGSGKRYYGMALMEAGFPVPVEMGEYRAYQFEFQRKKL
ncbi:alpha-galactosidase [bacterium C-53]|nr:alpha-galactosidase [Lachnospiraceae bacterium]NBI02223.1 alpha-galactosidase [Lachnospiraceae bacterium]RKJ08383.1 alpha-galactosidase [bacterium C-53]